MSARREDILNTFWDDEAVDVLSNHAVLLYLWSFTNPRCGMAGVYACKRRGLCDGRLTKAQLGKAIADLSEARFLFYVDGWVWVRSRVRHLSTINPNIARSIDRDLHGLPDAHEYRGAFWAEYHAHGKLTTAYGKAGLEIPHG